MFRFFAGLSLNKQIPFRASWFALQTVFCLFAVFLLQESSFAQGNVDFQRDIFSVFRSRCIQCHGTERQEGNLRLDQRDFAMKGGDSGIAILRNHGADSPIVQRVSSQDPAMRMPPQGDPLSDKEIASLKAWIDQDAVWPDALAELDPRLDHWAWQKLREQKIPTLSSASIEALSTSSSNNPIDAFLNEKLQQHGLRMNSIASKSSLIRRVYFDLLGVPPTAEQCEQFENDDSPDAYERLLDELLASPLYGERWARHWLDIAHYADTHGFERDQIRENAWRYRDYVIDAMNVDLPFDTFLREQIAGDVLAGSRPEAKLGASFLAAGPWDFVGQEETPSPSIKRLARADDLDDMVTQVMTSTCGVTINCARCHNHKLDPISQEEYYALWAIFSGVKRGDHLVSQEEQIQFEREKENQNRKRSALRKRISQLEGRFSLADVIGGGDGSGTGITGQGIDPLTGKKQIDKRDFLPNVVVNQLSKPDSPFLDAVFVPDGQSSGAITISSQGTIAHQVPKTSGQVWDCVRLGAVHAQHATTLAGVDYGSGSHSLLSMHANTGLTWSLQAIAEELRSTTLRLRGAVGYFGQTPKQGADVRIYIDGKLEYLCEGLGRDDGPQAIDLFIKPESKYLTILSTDGGNGIGHDQICFIDTEIVRDAALSNADLVTLESHYQELAQIEKTIADLPVPRRVYGVVPSPPAAISVLRRGNPEDPLQQVAPNVVQCIPSGWSPLSEDATDSERRIAFANWLTHEDNPLPYRVIVNRLWHHHFGQGIVATPSDFGLGGSLPSHPELLDWLAGELRRQNSSLKSIQRLICTSHAYRQSSSMTNKSAMQVDNANRLLWRQNPRRIDAESLRDSVLHSAGNLNLMMHGPGYRDFDYEEEYAPVYRYITPNRPDLWRRSIYRFVVRTTAHQFLTTLDCPNPANLTPTRNVTTTSIQSLALLNNAFILDQSKLLADRVAQESEAGNDVETLKLQVRKVYRSILRRDPTESQWNSSLSFAERHGLAALCRLLFNANEFVYVD